MAQCFALEQIVEILGGTLDGQSDLVVERLASLAHAQPHTIAFFNDTKYTQALSETQAGAIILRPEHRALTTLPCILTDNPYAYFARLASLFNPSRQYDAGVHPSVALGQRVTLAHDVTIDAHVSIGDDVSLGAGVRIGAGTVIESGVKIGEHTVLEPRVVVKYDTVIGNHCHLYSGCVIGNDGFGYAEDHGTWVKIPQVGRVIIGNYVDLGANTTIDRGAIDDTIIGDGVKMDNLVQVAHNVRIGAHTVIAGCVGIAGSAVIGAHCKIGGAAMILGHLSITDGVTISPGSMIMRSIHQAGTYTALMPFQKHDDWLKTAANIRHLEEYSLKLKKLEHALDQFKKHAKD